MCDSFLMELLHSEIVKYFIKDTNFGDTQISSLEHSGFVTGYKLIEKITKDQVRFKDDLEIMKFLCTEFWSSVFQKPIDNLRTNHQNVYILQDDRFRFLQPLAIASKQYLNVAPKYVIFTCGLVRGALLNLGLQSAVTSEIDVLPIVKFHIEISHV